MEYFFITAIPLYNRMQHKVIALQLLKLNASVVILREEIDNINTTLPNKKLG